MQFPKKTRSKNTSKVLKLGKSGPPNISSVSFPFEAMHVAIYLLSKIQTGHTFTTLEPSFYAIKYFHKIKKKKALSRDDLDKIFVQLNQSKTNLYGSAFINNYFNCILWLYEI